MELKQVGSLSLMRSAMALDVRSTLVDYDLEEATMARDLLAQVQSRLDAFIARSTVCSGEEDATRMEL